MVHSTKIGTNGIERNITDKSAGRIYDAIKRAKIARDAQKPFRLEHEIAERREGQLPKLPEKRITPTPRLAEKEVPESLKLTPTFTEESLIKQFWAPILVNN